MPIAFTAKPAQRLRADVLALAACVALFTLFPQLDLQVSSWLHDPRTGFRWANEPLVLLSYDAFKARHIGWLALALAVWLAAMQVSDGAPVGRRRAVAFLLALIVIGPVLAVNAGFKNHWGRARPVRVLQFGGERLYSPPLLPAMECRRNCSFVSGHAAAAFVLTGLYWVTGRRRWLVAGLALGSAVGLGRMLQGGHFLSDVVFAFWTVYLIGALLAWLMLGQRAPRAGAQSAADA